LDTTPKSVLQLTCDALTQIDDAQLAELLSHSRTRGSFSAIVSLLVKNNVDVAVRNRWHPRAATLLSQRARERLDWLRLLQVSEETIEVVGQLVGGSIEKLRFELIVGEESLSGSILESAATQLRQFHFGDRVQAKIRVITTEHEEALLEPAVSYRAESFSLPPAGVDDETSVTNPAS